MLIFRQSKRKQTGRAGISISKTQWSIERNLPEST